MRIISEDAEETIEDEVEEEESIDIKSVRLNYLEKFVQITKTWSSVLSGESTVNELKKIRSSLKESLVKRRTKRRRGRPRRAR